MKKIFEFIDNNTDKIILISAIVLSVTSFIYFYNHGLITAYGDSRGHLNIARRVVDSLTPGAAQLGGYWLPFLHILMLTTVWNNFMWQSGLSGSIPNMIFFVISSFLLYKITFQITKNKLSAFIAFLVSILNLNLLYMQSTPMTESIFVSLLIIAMYFLYKWISYRKIVSLLLAALFFSLASFTRYEGWLFVIGGSLLFLIDFILSKFNKKKEGTLILFTVIAWFSIGLWLLWGLVIFGDPLEFLHNKLSAGNQTKLNFGDTLMVGYHDLPRAFLTNIYAINHTVGPLILGLSVLGILVYIFRNKKNIFNVKFLAIFLLLTPLIFDVITVYTGNVPVEVPELSKVPFPGNYFNIRYALYTLPFIAIIISLLSKKKIVQIGIIGTIILNFIIFMIVKPLQIVSLQDAGIKAANYNRAYPADFKKIYDHGLILASTGGSDAVIYSVGINLNNYITEGTYHLWEKSLKDPQLYVRWIIMSKGRLDAVNKSIDREKVTKYFKIVRENESFVILKRKY